MRVGGDGITVEVVGMGVRDFFERSVVGRI